MHMTKIISSSEKKKNKNKTLRNIKPSSVFIVIVMISVDKIARDFSNLDSHGRFFSVAKKINFPKY